MKKPIADGLVAECIKRIRSGGPVGAVFPYPLSECEFTEAQRLAIKEARRARRKLVQQAKPQAAPPSLPQPKAAPLKPAAPLRLQSNVVASKPTAPVRALAHKAQALSYMEKLLYPTESKPITPKVVAPKPAAPTKPAPATTTPSLTKLEKILFLQQGKCFFCGEKLALANANIEHLHPLSLGGKRTEDNEVVCHKTLNETFGNLPLKRKFEFVLKAAGSFQCPRK